MMSKIQNQYAVDLDRQTYDRLIDLCQIYGVDPGYIVTACVSYLTEQSALLNRLVFSKDGGDE